MASAMLTPHTLPLPSAETCLSLSPILAELADDSVLFNPPDSAPSSSRIRVVSSRRQILYSPASGAVLANDMGSPVAEFLLRDQPKDPQCGAPVDFG